MADSEYPPYTPMPSLRHELGLLLGFFALCIVIMGTYIALWRVSQTRLHAQELARRKALGKNTDPARGITPAPVNAVDVPLEKMLDRYAMPRNHAELPVHGMELLGKGLASGKTGSSRMGSPGVSGSLSPVTPVSPLGGSGLVSRGVSPVGGIALDSIVGMALGEKKESLGGFRSSSPARRVGGVKPPVELGPAPSRE